MGVGFYSALLSGDEPDRQFLAQTAWVIFWTFTYGGVALTLLLATIGTFNLCLGRVGDPWLVDGDDLAPRGGKGGHARGKPAADPPWTEL